MGGDDRKRDPAGRPVGRRIVLGLLVAGALGMVTGHRAERHGPGARADRGSRPDRPALADSARRHLPVLLGHRVGAPYARRADYRLAVSGLVGRTATYTLADLQAMPQTALVRDFQCVTGWRVPQVHWAACGCPTCSIAPAADRRRDGGAVPVLRRHLHREPHPGSGPAVGRDRRAADARRPGDPRPRRPGADVRRADVRLQEHQVAVRHRAHRPRSSPATGRHRGYAIDGFIGTRTAQRRTDADRVAPTRHAGSAAPSAWCTGRPRC